MNQSVGAMDHSDSRYFSQRAKHISLLHKQSTVVPVQPSSSTLFQFSNRTYTPIAEPQLTPVGRGHGSPIPHDYRPSMSAGRGRTNTPVSSFVLQNQKIPSSSNTKIVRSPMFVMHEEVQFVRPYFGPPSHNDMQSLSTSQKREILLLALKQIESGLKTL